MFRTLPHYFRLMRLDRPIGIFLLLWPTLWTLWIATQGHPPLKIFFIFFTGVVIMRSAGCVINDFADRDIDLHVARTHDRPLAKKILSPQQAIFLFLFLCAIAFILVCQLNFFTLQLSIPALFLVIIYPFCKRYTYLPQFILGVAFSFSILMVFAAQQNHIPPVGWEIFLIGILWPVVYDTLYAMVDSADDVKIGVKSTALLFGNRDKIWVGVIQVLVLFLLFLLGMQLHLRSIYFVSLFGVVSFFVYQQYLIKDRKPENCFRAFKNNNYVGAIVFFGLLLSYLKL
jgi:4-hydroxybenzoate polyprenyltransferase